MKLYTNFKGGEVLTKFCPNCGTEMNDTSNFCPSCGTSQQPNESTTNVNITCSNCGSPIPQGSMTCVRCGTPLYKKDYKFVLIIGYILSIIAPIIGIIIGIYLLTRKDDPDVHKHGIIMAIIGAAIFVIGIIIVLISWSYQLAYYYYY